MTEPIVVDFKPDGTAECIYSDEVIEAMRALGPTTVRRASHVEPHPTKAGWIADMSPVGGPVLGLHCSTDDSVDPCDLFQYQAVAKLRPFPTHQAALDAERAWIIDVKGLGRVPELAR